MRLFRKTYAAALLAVTALAACTAGDELAPDSPQPAESTDGTVTVGIRLHAAGGFSANTRAAGLGNWEDQQAYDEEMMNVWTVVVTDAADKVVKVRASKPQTGDREIDQLDDLFELPEGTYKFYTFANIAPTTVIDKLGLTAAAPSRRRAPGDNNGNNDPTTGGNNDNNGNDNADDVLDIISPNALGNDPVMSFNGTETQQTDSVFDLTNQIAANATLTETAAKAVQVGVGADGFDLDNIGTAPNAFGITGIPMSNVQEYTINVSSTIDLVLVRTYAKIELQLYNETTSPYHVKSVTLSGISRNRNNNIMLLPNITGGQNTMEIDGYHNMIRPNTGSGYAASDFTYLLSTALTVPANTPYDEGTTPQKITFYVNESTTPTDYDGLFNLTLHMVDDSDNTLEYRYALISNENSEWNYIARNDYRIIPLVLDDYHIEMTPQDFPAIGVYPASVQEIDGLDQVFQMTFHDYGHFHLLPAVKKGTVTIPYASTAPTAPYGSTCWTLVDGDWTASFSSWEDHNMTTTYDNTAANLTTNPTIEGKFYVNVTPSPAVDGSENGGLPVFDTTTTPTTPYIFGKIAAPTGTGIKYVFHELKVNLYVEGQSAPRVLRYRFYMVLSDDRVTAARRRTLARQPHN